MRTKFDIYSFIAYLTWNDTIIENKQITSKFYFLGISILIFYIFILQIPFAHYIWYLHVNYIWRNKRAFCSILIWPSFWRLTPIWWWFLVLCWIHLLKSINVSGEELLTLPDHLPSSQFFCRVQVGNPLVFCVVLCWSLLVPFSLGHCIVCPYSIYCFWLPLSLGIFTFVLLYILVKPTFLYSWLWL